MSLMNVTIFIFILICFVQSEEVNNKIHVEYCPKNIETKSDGYGNAVVIWQEPKFVGKTEMTKIRVFPNNLPGRSYPVGKTFISYKAVEDFGNIAWCNFTVTVIEGVCNQPITSNGMLACLVVNGIMKVCASPCIKHEQKSVDYKSLQFCSNRGQWVEVELNKMDKSQEHLEGRVEHSCEKKIDLESLQGIIKENFITFLKMDTPFCWYEPEKRFCSPDHVKIVTYL